MLIATNQDDVVDDWTVCCTGSTDIRLVGLVNTPVAAVTSSAAKETGTPARTSNKTVVVHCGDQTFTAEMLC
jgi:hypothetical protein